MQVITKSGGNQYRGSLYAGFEDDRWQARNIDDGQIARGAASAPAFHQARRTGWTPIATSMGTSAASCVRIGCGGTSRDATSASPPGA